MANPVASVVIPAYNRSERIVPALRQVIGCIRERGWDAEVIVVNDGSTDTTARLVLDFSLSAPEVRLIENPGTRGKGFAVRNGVLQARGEVVLFTDADLSIPMEEAEKLFAALRAGADIAIGSRWLYAPELPQQPVSVRQLLGRCFNLGIRAGLGMRHHDTQCGFKAFTREAAQTVFQLQTVEGWGFDTEILFIAAKRHLYVAELAVRWQQNPDEPIQPLRDGYAMLREMALIRRNASLGRYDGPVQPLPQPAKRPPAGMAG